MRGRLAPALILALVAVVVGAPVVQAATVYVYVEENDTRFEDIIGPGVEENAFFFSAGNYNFGVDGADTLKCMDRLRKIEPKCARMFIAVNVFEPKDGVYDWTTYGMESMYHHLDLFQEMGVHVTIAGFQWNFPRWMCPYATSYWNPDNDELAEALVEFVYHLRETKGYTCVKALTPVNEPDWGLTGGINNYTDLLGRIDTKLSNKGIRNDVDLNGPDCCAPNDAYFEDSTELNDDETEIWCDHYYHSSYSAVAADTIERINWISSNDEDEDIEPLYIGEFNAHLIANDTTSWDFAFWTSYMAVVSMHNGASGMAYWVGHDYLNGPSHLWPTGGAGDHGLWMFKQDPASEYDDWQMRPVYYSYGNNICRFIEAGSDVMDYTESGYRRTYIDGVITESSSGDYTLVFTNRYTSSITLAVRDLDSVSSLDVYQLTSGTCPSDDRVLFAKTDTQDVSNGDFNYVLPAKSVTTFTEIAPKSTTAPVISNFAAGDVSGDTCTFTWDTNIDADSQVEYREDNDSSATWYSLTDQTLTQEHSVTVSGLMRPCAYKFRARSKDHATSDIARSDEIAVTTTAGGGFYDDFSSWDQDAYWETIFFWEPLYCLDSVSGGQFHYDSDQNYTVDTRGYMFRKQPTNSEYLTVTLVDATSEVGDGCWDAVALSFFSTIEPTWSHGDGYDFGYAPRSDYFYISRRVNFDDPQTTIWSCGAGAYDLPAKLEIVIDRSTSPDTYDFYINDTLVKTDTFDFTEMPHYVGIWMATADADDNAITSDWDDLADYDFTE